GNDAVVRAEHSSTQPADALNQMRFTMKRVHIDNSKHLHKTYRRRWRTLIKINTIRQSPLLRSWRSTAKVTDNRGLIMNRYLDIIGGLEDQVCRFQPVIIDFPRSSPSLRPRDENSDNLEDDEPHGQ